MLTSCTSRWSTLIVEAANPGILKETCIKTMSTWFKMHDTVAYREWRRGIGYGVSGYDANLWLKQELKGGKKKIHVEHTGPLTRDGLSNGNFLISHRNIFVTCRQLHHEKHKANNDSKTIHYLNNERCQRTNRIEAGNAAGGRWTDSRDFWWEWKQQNQVFNELPLRIPGSDFNVHVATSLR